MICCFSNRGDEVSMRHFEEIDFWLKNKKVDLFGRYRTSFSGERPFRYAQSGSERTSFSGSTVSSRRRGLYDRTLWPSAGALSSVAFDGGL